MALGGSSPTPAPLPPLPGATIRPRCSSASPMASSASARPAEVVIASDGLPLLTNSSDILRWSGKMCIAGSGCWAAKTSAENSQ